MLAVVIPFPQQPFSATRRKPPIRQPNKAARVREHLTPAEVAKMIEAARKIGGAGGATRQPAHSISGTARFPGCRAGCPAMGAIRFHCRHAACRASQAGLPLDPLPRRRRTARAESLAAPPGRESVRVHGSGRGADVDPQRAPGSSRSGQGGRNPVSGSSPSAPTCHGVPAGQRRPRHA